MVNILSTFGITSGLYRQTTLPTITKLRIISQQQQLIRLDFESNFSDMASTHLSTIYQKALEKANIVILSDYAKGTLKESLYYIKQAKMHHIPVIVDPKSPDFRVYEGATLVTPNQKEFDIATSHYRDEKDFLSKANRLIREHHFEALLVTQGKEGMTLFQANKKVQHFPVCSHEVFDVTGAGDTVIAVLSAGLAAGETLEDAARLANVAASIVVQRLGTASVNPHELENAICETDRQQIIQNGILSENELIKIVNKLQASDKKVIMTNGCFDILHPGHISYLQTAKKLGDYLIVAVNDDASVRRLKGAERPINTLETRMTMLAGLTAVDAVIAFSEDTPDRLIKKINPNILVKGGDYVAAHIAGSEHVISQGGEVKILPFVEGYSTSKLLNTIKEKR